MEYFLAGFIGAAVYAFLNRIFRPRRCDWCGDGHDWLPPLADGHDRDEDERSKEREP